MKYRLGNKHQILRAITAVRDIGVVSALASFQAQSFDRLRRNIKPSAAASRPSEGGYIRQGAAPLVSQSERVSQATKISVRATQADWIRSRSTQPQGADSCAAAKALFAGLEDSEGLLNCGTLIGHILTTGLSDSAKDLTAAFEATFACRNVYTYKLDEAAFIALFRTKRVVDRMIEVLTHSEVHTSPQSLLPDSLISWSFPTFTSMLLTLLSWWSILNPNKAEYVHIRKLADFLITRGLVGNRHEGQKLIRAAGKPVDDVYIRQQHYLCIFYPGVLKATMLNLALGLAADRAAHNASFRLRIADVERKLMLSGLKSRKGSSEKTAFAAYSEFVNAGKPFTQRKTQEVSAASLPSYSRDVSFERSPLRPATSAVSKYEKQEIASAASSSQDSRGTTQQRFFKSAEAQYVGMEDRLQRDTRLHQHFERMVDFASELDQVLAGCSARLVH